MRHGLAPCGWRTSALRWTPIESVNRFNRIKSRAGTVPCGFVALKKCSVSAFYARGPRYFDLDEDGLAHTSGQVNIEQNIDSICFGARGDGIVETQDRVSTRAELLARERLRFRWMASSSRNRGRRPGSEPTRRRRMHGPRRRTRPRAGVCRRERCCGWGWPGRV